MTESEREQREQRLTDKHNALTVHVVIALLKVIKDYYGTHKYDQKIELLRIDDAYRELKQLSKHIRYEEWIKLGVVEWVKNHGTDTEQHWRSVTAFDYAFLRNPRTNIKKHIDTERSTK